MEVCILDSAGFPADSLLSIRVGQQCRQGNIDGKKPFKFTASPEELKSMKIDVLQTVGGARVLAVPGAKEYTIPLRSGSREMQLRLGVAPSDGATGDKCKHNGEVDDNEAINKDGSKRDYLAAQARDYLDKHKLTTFIHSMLQCMFKSQPDNPYQWLAQQLMHASKEGGYPLEAPLGAEAPEQAPLLEQTFQQCVSGHPVPETPPVSRTKLKPAPQPTAVQTSASDTDGEVRGTFTRNLVQKLNDVNHQNVSEAELVVEATQGLGLEARLGDEAPQPNNAPMCLERTALPSPRVSERVVSDPNRQTRTKFRNNLLAGLKDGSLETVVTAAEAEEDTCLEPPALPSSPVSQRVVSDPNHQTRSKFRKNLLAGLKDGSLETVVAAAEATEETEPAALTRLPELQIRESQPLQVADVHRQPREGSGGACVVTGPSGVGKTTLVKRLMKDVPGRFGFSVSHTTRAPDPGEVDGVDYHFVSREVMEKGVMAGDFLEYTEQNGILYGTSVAAVEIVIQKGIVCLLELSVQGAAVMRQSNLHTNTTYVFVAPPTMEELESRLRGRNRKPETEDAIRRRLCEASQELSAMDARPGEWNLVLRWREGDLPLAHDAFRRFLEVQLPQQVSLIHRLPPASSGGACVVTGPSGVGKSVLIKRLMSDVPGRVGFSVSHTTRDPRPGEVDGVDYHFVTRRTMENAIAAGEFVEHAQVHGNLYGTSMSAVQAVIQRGLVCLLDIDIQGAESVRQSRLHPRTSYVFLAPPSLEELERRLRGRGTETEERIQLRLGNARSELAELERRPAAWDMILRWREVDLPRVHDEFRRFIEVQLPTQVAVVHRLPAAASGGACVVTGPSGVGKSTLIKRLMSEHPEKVGFSVSHTTREPRLDEKNGVDYHFVSRQVMETAIMGGEFVEYAEVHGHLYGTSVTSVQNVVRQGKVCLLDIDIQGAEIVRKSTVHPTTSYVFLAPPSMNELEARLRGRGTETQESIERRLRAAEREMNDMEARPEAWDLVLRWRQMEFHAAYEQFHRFIEVQMPEKPAVPAHEGATSIDELRAIARDAFVTASNTGHLSVVFREVGDIDVLRQDAMAALTRAHSEGLLRPAFDEVYGQR